MSTAPKVPSASTGSLPTANSRMVALLRELAHGEGFQPSVLPGVRFMRSTRHTPRTPVAYDPSIVIIAQGRKFGHLGEQRFTYDRNNYLVLSVPLPFECETFGSPEEPLLGLSVSVTPAAVAELAIQLEPAPTRATESPRAVEAAPLDPPVSEAALRLVESLRTTSDTRILGPQRVRELIYRVLQGPLGGNLRALAAPQSHFGQISQVLNRIHTQFEQVRDVESLAREAGMSVSTFHTHFKAVTSSSPLQYLKTIRLHKARMLMVHDGMNAGTAAHQVGYESVSQFSREFKRLFGAPPSVVAGPLREMLIRLA